MATIKISELEEVTELSSGDVLPIVNNNETKKVSIEKLNEILGGNTDDTSAARALKIEYYKDGATFDTEENRETISEYYTALREGEAPELFIAFNEFDGSVSGDNSYMYRASVISIDDYNLSLYCPTQVNTNSSQNRYGVNYNERYELEINVGINSSNNNYNATYINHYYTKGWSLNGNSSILGMNNTTAFTPTGDYNPATKKYVDDAIANSGGSGGSSSDNNGNTAVYTFTTDDYTGSDARGIYKKVIQEFIDSGYVKHPIIQIVNAGYQSQAIWSNPTIILNRIFKGTNGYSIEGFSLKDIRRDSRSLPSVKMHRLDLYTTSSNGVITNVSMVNLLTLNTHELLSANNDMEYIPSHDYNPATKKYVDDAITNAITTVLEAEY